MRPFEFFLISRSGTLPQSGVLQITQKKQNPTVIIGKKLTQQPKVMDKSYTHRGKINFVYLTCITCESVSSAFKSFKYVTFMIHANFSFFFLIFIINYLKLKRLYETPGPICTHSKVCVIAVILRYVWMDGTLKHNLSICFIEINKSSYIAIFLSKLSIVSFFSLHFPSL